MDKNRPFIIAVAAIAVAFSVRIFLFDFRSGDYNTFLVHWVDFFRQNGGFAALKEPLGNYNLPYLYFLALFSYVEINDLYLIKLLSLAFDIVLAFGMLKLTGLFTRSKVRLLAVYLITLLLPTVVLNGARWAQCDSIYVSFAVLALWAALSDKPIRSVVFIALSFAFKLQAVFLMPLWLVLIFAKKVRVWHLVFFPLTYFITTIPALLAGRPLLDTLLLYYNQADTVGTALNYNSPSIFALLKPSGNSDAVSSYAIAIAFLFVLLIFTWTFLRRKNLNNESLVFIALLFAIGIPFLLPHMHDRYFFMADVLTLLPAVLYAGYIPLAALTSFASLLCYHSYFKLYKSSLPVSYGAIALIGVLVILLILTASHLGSRRFSQLKRR
jgi:Gpi18-like mannosyltransferase